MNVKLLIVVLLLVLLSTVAVSVAPTNAQSSSNWDAAICDGTEGLVFRTVNATTSDLPATEGCENNNEMAWLVVEPWNRETNTMNPDRACLASSWGEGSNPDSDSVRGAADRMDWTEGSVWRVSVDLAENPLVVSCGDVEKKADLGLNPGEGQVELRVLRATIARANELLEENDYTRSQYIAEYGDTPISELFSIIDLFSMGN